MKTSDFDKDTEFIARHYREGLFDVGAALKRVMPSVRGGWTLTRIAACAAIFVAIAATAAIISYNIYFTDSSGAEVPVPEVEAVGQPMSQTIDFDDAPLPVVVAQIEMVYGVEIVGLSDDAADCRLSLHYEGTAHDLVDTINAILGTSMEVRP